MRVCLCVKRLCACVCVCVCVCVCFHVLAEQLGVLESVKAAADVYSPISGEVTEVNEKLIDEPELINKDPYASGL